MDLEKNYLVLDLTENEQDVIKLKAAMYGMKTEDLIKKSVFRFYGEFDTMDCPYCQKPVQRKPYSTDKKILVGGIEHIVTIRDFPMFKCSECSQFFYDTRVDTYSMRILKHKIQEDMLKGLIVPNSERINHMKINFEQLLFL